MKQALLLLIPLLAFGGTPIPQQFPDPFAAKKTTISSYPKYPQDYSLKERIKIDRLSAQLRLYDRTMSLTKSCTPKSSRARALHKAKYDELKQLEPTMAKYNQLKRYRR